LKVYFTVDTESSIGGAWAHRDRLPVPAERHVFCRIDGCDYGIPLITRILRAHGFRATHFVETLSALCLGEADSRSVFDYLLENGQDVQLHAHPVYWLLARSRRDGQTRPFDMLSGLSAEAQREVLGEAVDLFVRFAGRKPVAFRAGNWAGSCSLMPVLRDLGIHLDSSLNPCYHPEISFPDGKLLPNQIHKIDGVWELPVTVARTPLPEGHHGLKFADCSVLTAAELRNMLDSAFEAGQQHFVMVFHSFSAVKAQDDSYRRMRPNRLVIRRLEHTMRYLAGHPERFTVSTIGELALSGSLRESVHANSAGVPDLTAVQAGVRKLMQAINNFYWV
jgi:hypothetical protein